MILAARAIGVLAIVSFLCSAPIAAWFYFSTARFLEVAIETEGVVIEIDKSENSDGRTMYRPVFAFTADNGRNYEVPSSVSSGRPSHGIGDKVSILYDPEQPAEAELDSTWRLWLGAVIAGFLSAGALVTGLFFLVVVPGLVRWLILTRVE